ncbi:LysE family translocator [Pseudomonas donghuensis]|uniref:LysE family translocator n=1 Tax=Pseudomonas donghuensis TaxID=1163398 RepID=UPI0020C31608|nr:LysE family translocator [Pseudomonas donghuensis]MCP6699535.1 LysE family translocator [Pseudomonas donghuensis]
MALHLWLTFSLAYLLTSLIPGPNVLLTVRNALRHGPAGMGVTLFGNLLAQLLVISAVAWGVGAMLLALPTAFLALKVVGAGYLIYLGAHQLFARKSVSTAAAEVAVPAAQSKWRIGTEAFLVSASNPKTLIFFCAFLPQFLDHARPIAEQFTVMYLTSTVIVCGVHSFYSFSAMHFRKHVNASRVVAALKRATGALFIGLGVRLLSAKAV